MVTAFIFDVDGTLIDSNDYHARAWERALARHGKNIPASKIRPHIGKGADQLLPVFLSKTEMESFGKAVNEAHGQIFKHDYFNQLRPFGKVRELFKAIRGNGARIALASSAKEDEVKPYEIIAQIEDLVEQSTSADDAQSSKPAPDIFHAAVKSLGYPPKQHLLVVGDTPYDAQAACKAGLNSIGVLCGGFPEAELWAHGCKRIFADPEDILRHLDEVMHLIS